MSDGIKRRDFLKVLGVTGAGAAVTSCSPAPYGGSDRLISYVTPAEEIVPGVPTVYASTCRECPAGCGILVETHSGRATKVEGNPAHPVSRGNLCARGQASVQGLYHPDRITGPAVLDEGIGLRDISWTTAGSLLAQRIREAQARGGEIVLLSGAYGGTMAQLADTWAGAVGARRIVFDPWGDQPRDLDFAEADFLVAFGADFLETWGSPVEYAGQFARMHAYRDGRKGKFVWVGPHRPLTGLNADEWVAARPGTEVLVAMAMAGTADVLTVSQQTGVPEETLTRLTTDFRAGRGVALGPGAATSGGNAQALRQAVNQLNGQAAPAAAGAGMQELLQAVEQMRTGQVEVILIDGVNPAYTLPGGVRFAEALANVRTRVSFATFPDDTSRRCNLILPSHHFLEAWDDYESRPGVNSLVQPTMRPVFNTRQPGDVLISSLRALGLEVVPENSFYDYLRSAWGAPGDELAWHDTVRAGGQFPVSPEATIPQGVGFMAVPAPPAPGAPVGASPPTGPGIGAPVPPEGLVPDPAGTVTPQTPLGTEQLTDPPFEGVDDAAFYLVVYPSYRFYDGRSANRPWLLELPDPVTKVSWQSWVEIHPDTAAQLGVRQGEVVEVVSPYGRLETFVYVYPGVRPDTVAIQVGLGHEAFGRYSQGRGVNPNVLLGPTLDEAGNLAPYGVRVAVRRVAGKARPGPNALFEQGVRVQYDRDFAQAVSLAELRQREATAEPEVPGERIHVLKGAAGFGAVPTGTDPASYPPPGTRFGEYHDGHPRWAMVVDTSRCIGCSACVIACNAENNIPVVGPDDIRKGRELHWLRIERYWGVSRDPREAMTSEATDDTRFLPMLCQHCGNAPCEPVCPVYAAYHTPDGLNAQVYNRCVGTRYCANNCPYKVRVFNWFTYEYQAPLNWQLNPDVTVREKGVMEKCTFCVQRIHQVQRDAARTERQIQDGEIAPACVQTCPTEVFVFGNIKDPTSAVARAARSHRSYRVLEEINTQPAIVYLQKVTLHEPARGAGHGTPVEASPSGAASH
jgi:anaerobic selenocysteine-containing dehydrogenase/Fe-S-cluster-containing dehydrogenase component